MEASEPEPILVSPPVLALYDGKTHRSLSDRASRVRLRRNRYVERAAVHALDSRAQHVMHAIAAARQFPQLVLSHSSAAALLGMPLIGAWPDQVECTVPIAHSNQAQGLHRHRAPTEPEIVTCDELILTSPAQTAVDLARHWPLETGVAAMDHVLHHRHARADDLRRLWAAIPRGGRGRAKARLAMSLADGDAESPGESFSRVVMYQLGFPKPLLQVEIRDAADRFVARADFRLAPGLLGEFDGRVKYQGRDGMPSAEDSVWREKLREDAIRREGEDVARWVWADLRPAERLGQILRRHGLRATHQPWF